MFDNAFILERETVFLKGEKVKKLSEIEEWVRHKTEKKYKYCML